MGYDVATALWHLWQIWSWEDVSVMEWGILSVWEHVNPAVICVITFVILSGLVDVTIFTGIVIFLSV